MARPTIFTEELGDEICSYVMSGDSLAKICRLAHMPEPATVYRWFRLHKEFCDNYARAKEDQADYFVEDILTIADEAKSDDIQVAKLRVDTRKWAASKYKPKKYGDATLMKMADSEGQNLQVSVIKFGDIASPPSE